MSCLSISGLYFLTGWVSKDAILLAMFRSTSHLLGLILFYAGALLTMTYCVRLCFSCFSRQASIVPLCCSSSAPALVIVPSLSLVILRVLEGWVLAHSSALQCPVVNCLDSCVLLFLFVISYSLATILPRRMVFTDSSFYEAGSLVGLALTRTDSADNFTSLEAIGGSALGLSWCKGSLTSSVPSGRFAVRTLLFLRLGVVLV